MCAALALGACASEQRGDRPQAKSGSAARCADFDRQPAAAHPVGAALTDGASAIALTVKRFQWTTAAWTTTGQARIEPAQKAGGQGQALRCDNVTVSFGFGPASGLTLKFGEYGGNLNIEVNGDFRNVANLSDLHGAIVGGAEVAVTGGGGSGLGMLRLTGRIDSFAIGGQELWIDEVCASAP